MYCFHVFSCVPLTSDDLHNFHHRNKTISFWALTSCQCRGGNDASLAASLSAAAAAGHDEDLVSQASPGRKKEIHV